MMAVEAMKSVIVVPYLLIFSTFEELSGSYMTSRYLLEE